MEANLIGKRFGKLTVVKFSHRDNRKFLCYECLCDCGNTIVARSAFLKNGVVQSCGCPVTKEDLAKYEPAPVKVEIGQTVRFDPFRHITGFASDDHRGRSVRCKVVYVNEPHKWFSVEYGKPKARTSFNFCDIGHGVQLLK